MFGSDAPGSDAASRLRPEYAGLLSQVDIFTGMDNIALAQFSAYLESMTVGPGEQIFRQGDRGDSFYIVVRGTFGAYVTSADGRVETRVTTIQPREYFGQAALLTGDPRLDTIRSDGEGELLRLPRERFIALLKRYPEAGIAVTSALSRRLRSVSQVVAESESAAIGAIESVLEELSADSRGRLLRVGLLEKPSPEALNALFGPDAAAVADDLARLGAWDERAATALHALRRRLDRELGAEESARYAARAVDLLARAGRWDDALSILVRQGQRDQFVQLLGRALRAIPPIENDLANGWLERLSDAEAAADPELALARAALLEERGQIDAASELLRQSLGKAMMGDPTGSGRLMEALGRLSAVGSRSAASYGYAMATRAADRPRLRNALTPMVLAAATLLGVAGGITASGNPQLGLVLLLLTAIILWAVDLAPSFVVALGLLTSFVLLGIATPAQALAGFGSMDWLFVVAVFGIAEAVMRSGLLFRVGLLLVRRLPSGLFWQAGALLLTGVAVSPLLPFNTVRATLTGPLALAVAEASRLKERSAASALLGMAAYVGAVPLGFMFLNGSAQSLLLWSLLPEASQRRFDPINWLLASLPLGVLISFATLGALFLLYRPESPGAARAGDVSLQLAVLGPLSRREMSMIAVLAAALVGWMFAPALRLDLGTVAILGLIGATATGNLSRQAIKNLDWNFLIFYGAILCVARVASALGLDRSVAGLVAGLVLQVGAGPGVFLIGVAVATILSKSVLVANQAAPLLGLALIPVAPLVGVDPWLVVITILVLLFVWFPPSQNPMYLAAYSASEGRLYSNGQAARANLVYVGVSLAGLLVSLPLWKVMGLI